MLYNILEGNINQLTLHYVKKTKNKKTEIRPYIKKCLPYTQVIYRLPIFSLLKKVEVRHFISSSNNQ